VAEGFDAVVNLFTSFGYFDEDEENALVIKEIERLLKPGGKFIIDFLNPDYVASKLVPESVRQEGALTIKETRAIEDGYVRKRIVISRDGEPDRHYSEQVRLYKPDDFKRMLTGTGLHIDHLYGDYDASAYQAEQSPRSIMVGHKRSV
jgi:SAM-dependent methyltransferase